MKSTDMVCLNPFAVINGCPLTIPLIASTIAEVEPSSVWAGRAVALTEAVAPLLSWADDRKESGLTSVDVTALLRFDNLCAVSDSEKGSDSVVPSGLSIDLPTEVVTGINGYLGKLPGFRHDGFLAETSPARAHHLLDMSVVQRALTRLERSEKDPETVHA